MSDETTVAPNAAARVDSAISGWTRELSATFALAWPLVIAQLAQTALTTTDVIMLGWLGPQALAAGKDDRHPRRRRNIVRHSPFSSDGLAVRTSASCANRPRQPHSRSSSPRLYHGLELGGE